MQFVWPYWHGGARGDELRFSIRSVEKFFDSQVKCTLIGDRPPWFTGHVIDQERVNNQQYRGFRDMLAKVHTMAHHPEIDEKFVWMMDDIYFLRDLSWDDLNVPRAYRWADIRTSTWQRLKSNSMRQLKMRGRTTHDYATHLPHTAEKEKLRQIFRDFDLVQNTMLWEVLYGNLFRENPQEPGEFFVRTSGTDRLKTIQKRTSKAFVLNHTDDGWNAGMREFLLGLLPDPSPNEGESVEVPFKTPEGEIRTPKKVTHVPINSRKTLPHYLLIQSAYTDPELSRRRLAISRATCIPSLKEQTQKPVIHVVVNAADPLLDERKAAFLQTGCEVKFIERDRWKLYAEDWELPAIRRVTSRVDDDDILCRQFIEMVNKAAPASGDYAITWPTGYVYWRGQFYTLTHPGNQFVSLVSSSFDPHQIGHWEFHKSWKTKVVTDAPGWIWVRHGDTSSSTLEKYRTRLVRNPNLKDMPIDVTAVDMATAGSGVASENYRQHATPAVKPQTVSDYLKVFGSDKVTLHSYGKFYDSLFERVKPSRLLEIGGYRGASMKAWKAASPGLWSVVIDRTPIPGHDTILCVTPDYWPAIQRLSPLPQLDVIIDDGSHKVGCQVSGANNLMQFLRPGGVYAIEDLQNQDVIDYFSSQGWTIEDYRIRSGRYDDVIAWKVK